MNFAKEPTPKRDKKQIKTLMKINKYKVPIFGFGIAERLTEPIKIEELMVEVLPEALWYGGELPGIEFLSWKSKFQQFDHRIITK